MLNNIDAINKLNEDVLSTEEDEVLNDIIEEELREAAEDQEELDGLCEASDIQALFESRKFKKRTIVKFNKVDDLTRRTKVAAIHLGRKMGLRQVDLLDQLREKERKLIKDIEANTALMSRARVIARKAQTVFSKTPTFTDQQQRKADGLNARKTAAKRK